jgi:hypothetical protein
MNIDDTYRAWKKRPSPLNIPPDFAGEVMRRVHREAEQKKAGWNWPGVLELFHRNVSFQYGALAIAAVAGLSRLWLMVFAILQP